MKLTEKRFQNWRALAVDLAGKERLLCLGYSHIQVKESYVESFSRVLTADERKDTRQIHLQQWDGIADRGNWTTRTLLSIPVTAALAG